MRFKDLAIGDTFDFISPDRMLNSFYRPCRKTAARKYMDDARMVHTVGSTGCTVYHVNELDADHPLVGKRP